VPQNQPIFHPDILFTTYDYDNYSDIINYNGHSLIESHAFKALANLPLNEEQANVIAKETPKYLEDHINRFHKDSQGIMSYLTLHNKKILENNNKAVHSLEIPSYVAKAKYRSQDIWIILFNRRPYLLGIDHKVTLDHFLMVVVDYRTGKELYREECS
jgi:hypothetical protein